MVPSYDQKTSLGDFCHPCTVARHRGEKTEKEEQEERVEKGTKEQHINLLGKENLYV